VAASIGALDRRETCVHAEVCAGTPTWSPSARSPPPERAAGGRKARSSSAEQSGAVSRAAAVPVLSFFASEDNGERWLAGRPEVRGYVMTG
jgi:hypothetical protein